MALHCAEAGQIEKAIGYLIAASQQAFGRSAMAETESSDAKVSIWSLAFPTAARRNQELELQLVRGQAC